jgi:hypothetical protein
MKSGYRPEDIYRNTLKYFEAFGIEGFLETDGIRLGQWSEAILKLNEKINNSN